MAEKYSSDQVFVGGLPQDVTESQLQTIFSELKIKRIVEMNSIAIIEFENTSKEITKTIREKNETPYKENYKLRVSYANKEVQKREVASTSDLATECSSLYMKYVCTGLHIYNPKKNKKKVMDTKDAHIVFYIGIWTGDNEIHTVESKEREDDSAENHAEFAMIDKLKNLLRDGDTTVYVYISKSPCHKCSKELISFSNWRGIKFVIKFAGLYRCKRESCEHDDGCNPGPHHRKHEQGLRSLNQHKNFDISTLSNKRTWGFLEHLLATNFTSKIVCYENHKLNDFDFKDFLNVALRVFKDQISERYKEDLKVKNDFDKLMKHVDSTDDDDPDKKEVEEKQQTSELGNMLIGKNSTDSDTQSFGETSKDQENQQIDNQGEQLCKYRKRSSSQKEARLQRSRKVYKRNKSKNKKRVQLKDNLSSDSESDSDFDSWISGKLVKHQQSESYKNLQKVIKERKSAEYSSNQDMEDESICTISDSENDSDFDSWISKKLEKHQQSQSYINLQKVIKERKSAEYSNNQDMEDESICTISDSETDPDFDPWISETFEKHQQSESFKSLQEVIKEREKAYLQKVTQKVTKQPNVECNVFTKISKNTPIDQRICIPVGN